MFTETHLVSGKKSDILVEGASASVKHDTPFNISIISSQLGGTAAAGLQIRQSPGENVDNIRLRLPDNCQ